MEHLSTQVERRQIEWHWAKVLELSSQGHSQREIADTIHVGIGTINRDMAYLRNVAQENLKTHIQDKLPEEYQNSSSSSSIQLLDVIYIYSSLRIFWMNHS